MKTIFITGGSTGIGAATVRKFYQEGWNVGFMDLNETAAQQLVASLAEGPASLARILFTKGNTRQREDIHRAVEATVAKFGGLDAVVANAGIHRSNTLLDITDEELDLMIQTNIYGTVNTLREAVPHLVERGGGSVVINASDQWFIGKAHSFAYGLTKGALGQITRSLAIDLGPKNIRVNAVCPSTIHTPLVDQIFERCSKRDGRPVQEYWDEENALFIPKRVGKPEEVAAMIYFLCSEDAGFCTGGHYLVDGGLCCQ